MPALLAAALIVFLEGLGFGVILPVLTPYADALGGGVAWAGVLFALSTLPRVIFGPFWGRISDHIGRRWTLAIVTFGTLAASLLWAWAPPLGEASLTALTWLLISRAVYGIFAGQSVLALAVASDVSRPEKRAAAMGVVGAAFGVAFTIGPALGGWFAASYSQAGIGYLAAAAQILSLIVIFALLRETHPHHTADEAGKQMFPEPSSVLRLTLHPGIAALLVMTLLGTIAYSVMLPTFQPISEDWYGWSIDNAGYALAVFGLIGAFVQGGLIRPTVKRFGEKTTAVFGLLVLGAGLGWVALHPGEGGFWGATCLMAAGTGFSVPAITALLSLSVGEADQGAIHGLNYSATSMGRGTGYLVGGFVFQHVSHASAYAAGAGAALLAIIMVIVIAQPHRVTATPVSE